MPDKTISFRLFTSECGAQLALTRGNVTPQSALANFLIDAHSISLS